MPKTKSPISHSPSTMTNAQAKERTSPALAARPNRARRFNLRAKIAAETKYLHQNDRESERIRAHINAISLDGEEAAALNPDTTLARWSPNRTLNMQDFPYLFRHRNRFPGHIKEWLEIISSKLHHVNREGKDGFFKKLQRNVGWTSHITPLVMAEVEPADKLVRCGLWSSAKNSRRCHQTDLCPLCLYVDYKRLLEAAYGPASGAINRAQHWWFITIGYTSNAQQSKCNSRPLELGDLAYRPDNYTVDKYPVTLGYGTGNEAFGADHGYDAARALGSIAQQAMGKIYGSKLVHGYRHKLEGAFAIFPGQPNRVNLHGHAVANGAEPHGDYIASELYEGVGALLQEYSAYLDRPYYPDIQVLRIETAKDLKRCLLYTEKVIPVNLIVAEAMDRPEAKQSDGQWCPKYADFLKVSLQRLVHDDIPAIFKGLGGENHLHGLRRRKTVGNMTFRDKGDPVGREPRWHKAQRKKRANDLRKAREARKQEEARLIIDDPGLDEEY